MWLLTFIYIIGIKAPNFPNVCYIPKTVIILNCPKMIVKGILYFNYFLIIIFCMFK